MVFRSGIKVTLLPAPTAFGLREKPAGFESANLLTKR